MPRASRQADVSVSKRTNPIIRIVRWSRLAVHIGVGLFAVGVLYPRYSPQRRSAFTGWWARKLLRILNVLVSAHGLRPDAGAKNLIVASNHVSWLDIFVINATQPSRFIAKSEVRDWPIAGWLCEKAGTIFIHRTRRSDTARINETMRAILAEGTTIGLFPEGTTTAGDKLLKFHTSLFEPAVANEATIAPAAIRYRHGNGETCNAAAFIGELSFAESVGQIISQKSMIAEITFAPQIVATGQTRRELAQKAESAVAIILDVPMPHAHHRFTVNDSPAPI
jgi:1-acyl-sn-glycerol-3-phosphate acyltransferase